MPVDPNIALQAGQGQPVGPNVGQVITLQQMAQRLRMQNQAQQGYNYLGTLYSNPQNVGPNGTLTPDALRQLMTVSPVVGMDMMSNTAKLQGDQARTAFTNSKLSDAIQDKAHELRTGALSIYDDTLKKSGPEAAQRAAQEYYSEHLPELKQLVGSGFTGGMPEISPTFDADRARRAKLAYDAANAKPIEPAQQVQLGMEQQRLGMDKQRLGIEQQKELSAEFDKPQNVQYTDASGKKQTGVATYDKVARKWFDDDGKELKVDKIVTGSANPKVQAFDAFLQAHPDATPEQQAAFLQSTGAAPRSAPAMAIRKFMEEHPDASSDDIARFAGKVAKETSAARAFGTGQQGNQVRSLNVVSNHLDTITQLGDALQNGDVRTINKLRNAIKTEFGVEGPVNFNVAKQIVGDEVVKAVIGSGAGGVTDRAALQQNFDAANTPAQLNGVVKTAKQLIAGQYEGLRQQYEQSTGLKDFDDLLSPGAKKMLGEGGKPTGGGAETASNAAPAQQQASPAGAPREVTREEYDALPAGTPYRVPGKSTVFYKQ